MRERLDAKLDALDSRLRGLGDHEPPPETKPEEVLRDEALLSRWAKQQGYAELDADEVRDRLDAKLDALAERLR